MPKCPNESCDLNWFWDWCDDIYRLEDGTHCKETIDQEGNLDDGYPGEKIHFHCPCGQLLGTQTDDGIVGESPKWKDVDWDRPEHSHTWAVPSHLRPRKEE